MNSLAHAFPMSAADKEEASDGTIITVNADGSVDIDMPSPAVHTRQDDGDFDQNLAETLDDGALSQIANDYLDGVNADILSRTDFIQNYNNGIDLLGLKIDAASTTRGNRSSISRSKNPSLLKACVRSQSLSRGQLLPAAGPAKIQTISGESQGEDEIARQFGIDLNYFLTDVDRGYYPDSDRMLFYRAFGGSAYKKVYRDPLLQRPCSRFVPLEGLIVSEDASSLEDAMRKTYEGVYSPVQVARMQARGGWLDTDLGTPMQNISPARRKILESQGLSAATTRSQDTSFTIYEGYWSFCPEDYGWDDRKAELGMPAPYRIVMDRDSRKVLALHRNWKKDDDMFNERQTFVKYGLVPGLGFLDYGFLHLIGNQTRVLTAIWQIMIDHGMIANFPSGFKAAGVRTATNEINPGLGEFVQVELGNAKSIKDVLMGMPYGPLDGSLLQLAEALQQDVDKLSGTLEIPTGEGTSNTPVGTILAMIEQQAQDLTAVQQRDHRAQKDELRLIRDLFSESPEDLKWLKRRGAKFDWAQKVEEFNNMDLVPVSDPNIPSQAHRILINQFIVSLAEKAPYLFGSRIRQVAKRVLLGAGVNDADDLLDSDANIQAAMKAQQQGGHGNGSGQASLAKTQMEMPIKQAELQIEEKRLALEEQENQRQAANESADTQLRTQRQQVELSHAEAELQQEERRLQTEQVQTASDVLPDPQAEADLQKTRAGAYQAMGVGAAGYAKAGETTAQGERDATDFENGTVGGVEPTNTLQSHGAKPKKAKKPKAKG